MRDQNPYDSLVNVSLDGYLAFFLGIAVLTGFILWYLRSKEVRERRSYFSQYNATDLRMSRTKLGVVFLVIEHRQSDIWVVPVWSGKAPVSDQVEYVVEAESLIPFDEDRIL